MSSTTPQAICRLLFSCLREFRDGPNRESRKTETRALKSMQIRTVNSSPRNIVWNIDSMTNAHPYGGSIISLCIQRRYMLAINRFPPNYGESVNLVQASIFSGRAMQKVTSTNKWNQKALHCHILLSYHGIRQLIIVPSRTVRDSLYCGNNERIEWVIIFLRDVHLGMLKFNRLSTFLLIR